MEQWKAIPGYEGIYEASNYGRIRSAEGKTTFSSRHGVVHWKQRLIKQHYMHHKRNGNPRKDARITLWKDKEPHYHLVARLIAMTWCEGYGNGMTVNHIDGNTENNNADNLEWVSLAENIRKGFKNGLYPCKPCSLVDAEGNRIDFRSYSEASRFLGKNTQYVSDAIAKGRLTINGGEYLIVGR